jgi:hypothetical protein
MSKSEGEREREEKKLFHGQHNKNVREKNWIVNCEKELELICVCAPPPPPPLLCTHHTAFVRFMTTTINNRDRCINGGEVKLDAELADDCSCAECL